MATPCNDRYIDRILNYILAEEYQDAIQQCSVALDVYDTVQQGFAEYRRGLSDIKTASATMKSAAELAENGLKDDIGQTIVRVVREYSQNTIDLCSMSADNADSGDADVRNRIEYVQMLKAKAIQLAEEKERKKREERSGQSENCSR